MKNFWIGIVLLIAPGYFISCTKTSFIESPNAQIRTSVDTVRFDTVFATTGSITKSFKIKNLNDQKLRLANIRLTGGSSSPFKINVDGSPGISFNNIEVEANDSVYVFVSVVINPTAANIPFIVQDSILINFNGNNKYVQLEAFGQNAKFLRNTRVTKDSSWNNDLPIVILDGVTVNPNVALTINKGTRVFFHADAPMIVHGTLKVNGERFDSTKVTFAGDRLDQYYRDFPGSWPGIYFSPTSKNNVLTHAILKNGYQAIITEGLTSSPKIALNECIIDNIYDVGILAVNSSITARNCLISNCGNNIALGGGDYNFNHCTVASYGNLYLDHKKPVLFLSRSGRSLRALFRNCIFWGEGGTVDNEIQADTSVKAGDITFDHILYKAKNDPVANFINSNKNTPPLFDSINTNRRIFDFRINRKNSLAVINKGTLNQFVPFDLDGKQRPGTIANPPDLGCYEKQ
jgi:hypothetical protein